MGVTGLPIGPKAALAWELATDCVSAKEFPRIRDEMLKIEWSNDCFADVDTLLSPLQSCFSNRYDAVLKAYEANVFSELDIDIIIDKLGSQGEWGVQLIKRISELSPLSIQVFLEQCRRSSAKDFRENMQQELHLAEKFLAMPDVFDEDKYFQRRYAKLGARRHELLIKPLGPLYKFKKCVLV